MGRTRNHERAQRRDRRAAGHQGKNETKQPRATLVTAPQAATSQTQKNRKMMSLFPGAYNSVNNVSLAHQDVYGHVKEALVTLAIATAYEHTSLPLLAV